MSLRAFKSGANVIAYEKNGHKFGMTCGWSTMLDYDKLGMLLGSQSITGKNLSVGDTVGVSALAKNQKDVALVFGDGHSDVDDKFKNAQYLCKNGAILVKNAKVNMICKVSQLLHLFEGAEDVFVVLYVLEYESNKDLDFLSFEDVLPE